MFSAKNILNGTWAELWLDSELMAETYACKAEQKLTKEPVNLCGQMEEDSKNTKINGTGSLKMYKVFSTMQRKLAEVKNGKDVRFTLVSNRNDPDAKGNERVVLYNVSFDTLILIDWEAGKIGTEEYPFTFTTSDAPDLIAE